MPERFKLSDEVFGGAFGLALAEVVVAEVAVELTGGEHVPAGDEDRVLDRVEGAAVAAARAQPPVLGGEVDVLLCGWPPSLFP